MPPFKWQVLPRYKTLGIAAERVYVARAHPDWRQQKSALLNKDGRSYDSNTYRAADGAFYYSVLTTGVSTVASENPCSR